MYLLEDAYFAHFHFKETVMLANIKVGLGKINSQQFRSLGISLKLTFQAMRCLFGGSRRKGGRKK